MHSCLSPDGQPNVQRTRKVCQQVAHKFKADLMAMCDGRTFTAFPVLCLQIRRAAAKQQAVGGQERPAAMGKGWLGTSPQSMADRQFVSDSVQSLPPVRVCTPPARGEGAILRGNYTSSSSEVSLERTPRDYALYGAGRYAAPRPLPHWHSAPAEDPGHLRAAAGEAQHTQVLLWSDCWASNVT